LPEGAVAGLGGLILRPDGHVRHLAFSADGKTLLTVGHGMLVQVWDTATGRERRQVQLSPATAVMAAAVRADGKTIFVATPGGPIRSFNLEDGKEEAVIAVSPGLNVQSLSLSADGKTLVAADGKEVLVWKGPRQDTLKISGAEGMAAVAVTPDGKRFVLARPDRSLRLLETATGKEVQALEPPAAGRPQPHFGPPRLAVSPDGKVLAMASATDTSVGLYSLEKGGLLHRIHQQQAGVVHGLAFSPNSRFLAVGGYPGVRVYGVASGRELRLLDSQQAMVAMMVAFAPDGRTLATLGQDQSLRLWDVVEGRTLLAPHGHSTQVSRMVFLGGGKRLASYGGDGRLLLWDVATGRDIDECRGVPYAGGWLLPTADGKGVQTFSHDLRLFTWRPGSVPESERLSQPGGPSFRHALSPGGRFLAKLVPPANKLHLYDLRATPPRERVLDLGPQGWTNLMVFSDDGRRLATGTGDGVLRVWDCATGRQVHDFTPAAPDVARLGYASHLQFAADGRSLLLFNGELRVVEVASGQERMRVGNLGAGLNCMALSPDGRLAARGSSDGTLTVYATASGKELLQRKGRQGMVTALAFSEDGRLLASGGSNGSILVWKMPAPPPPEATLTDARRAELWGELASADAAVAGRAVEALAAAPGPAVELIRQRLKATGGPTPSASKSALPIWIATLLSSARRPAGSWPRPAAPPRGCCARRWTRHPRRRRAAGCRSCSSAWRARPRWTACGRCGPSRCWSASARRRRARPWPSWRRRWTTRWPKRSTPAWRDWTRNAESHGQDASGGQATGRAARRQPPVTVSGTYPAWRSSCRPGKCGTTDSPPG
jgi:WD40 repeat protein